MVWMTFDALQEGPISMFSMVLLKPLRFDSSFFDKTAKKVRLTRGFTRGRFDWILNKKGLIRASNLQQNLQQQRSFRLRLRYCCATVSIISSYLTVINVFHTIPYKPKYGSPGPKVVSSSLTGDSCNSHLT